MYIYLLIMQRFNKHFNQINVSISDKEILERV
jgi:hypothetical protein